MLQIRLESKTLHNHAENIGEKSLYFFFGIIVFQSGGKAI